MGVKILKAGMEIFLGALTVPWDVLQFNGLYLCIAMCALDSIYYHKL